MLAQRVKWLIGILIVVLLQSVFIWGKEKVNGLEPKQWIGIQLNSIQPEMKKYIEDDQIKLVVNEENIITNVFIKTPNVSVDSIKVGDTADKILKVYPKEWVISYPNYILILKGKASSFGVATDYIIYLIENERVKEVQLGNTANFSNIQLPKSNAEAEDLLQGNWVSEHNTIMKFEKGHLENSLLQELYDYQEYQVISPNKMLISKVKDGKVEKIYLRFMTDGKILYLFDINQLGIPIQKTIEKFRLR